MNKIGEIIIAGVAYDLMKTAAGEVVAKFGDEFKPLTGIAEHYQVHYIEPDHGVVDPIEVSDDEDPASPPGDDGE